MKKLLILGIFLLYNLLCYSQNNRYDYVYDVAGNQITANRFVYFEVDPISAEGKNTSETENYERFYEEDTFSYYPNPVREELYLKWDNKEDEVICSFKVFSPNGALLKEYNGLENERQYMLPFSDYPQGFYIVQIQHTDGSVKSITIVKK